jgi:hypothetical protein
VELENSRQKSEQRYGRTAQHPICWFLGAYKVGEIFCYRGPNIPSTPCRSLAGFSKYRDGLNRKASGTNDRLG